MSVIFDTDERLKGYLDTNQYKRECLCRGIANLDSRFLDLENIHPRGGPDGGKDFKGRSGQNRIVYGAVSFKNQATDETKSKTEIKGKFEDDLKSALANEPKPNIFLFFTNVNLTRSEKEGLREKAGEDFDFCEIYDRERIKSKLNDVEGLLLRFQYLDIPISPEEQKSFFNRWGKDLHGIITDGVKSLDQRLARIEFSIDAKNPLKNFQVLFGLEPSGLDTNGRFAIYCNLHREFIDEGPFTLTFGSEDCPPEVCLETMGRNYLNPIYSQWCTSDAKSNLVEQDFSTSSGRLIEEIYQIGMFTADFYRKHPRMTMNDLDRSNLIFFASRNFAERIRNVHFVCNGYLIESYERDSLRIDPTIIKAPVILSHLIDDNDIDLVRIRPDYGSTFFFNFADMSPVEIHGKQSASMNLLHELFDTNSKGQDA